MQALGPELQQFLTHLRVERRLADRTLAMYAEALQRLQDSAAASGVELKRAGPQHLRQWVGQLRTRGLAPRSIAIALAAWRGLYRWWGRQGVLLANPVDGLRAPRAAKPLPKALSVEQAMGLVGQPDTPGAPALAARDRAICELLYGCGLRVAELLGLDVVASTTARESEWGLRLRDRTRYRTSSKRSGTFSTGWGPNRGCDLQPLIRLTDNYSALRTAVNNMSATGNTNVPLGTIWGWHTLSPNAPFGDGRAYGTTRLTKIIIIMTDGENVMSDRSNPNRGSYSGLGYIYQNRLGITSGSDSQRRTAMDNRFDHPTAGVEDMCGNMKDQDIEVYTVAVQVDGSAQTLLRRCATDADHYFPVDSAAGIGALLNVLNPDVVVLAGGVVNAGEALFGPLKAEVRRRAFAPAVDACRIVPGELGGSAGVVGAIAGFKAQTGITSA